MFSLQMTMLYQTLIVLLHTFTFIFNPFSQCGLTLHNYTSAIIIFNLFQTFYHTAHAQLYFSCFSTNNPSRNCQTQLWNKHWPLLSSKFLLFWINEKRWTRTGKKSTLSKHSYYTRRLKRETYFYYIVSIIMVYNLVNFG